MTINPLDALSSLTQGQLGNMGALNANPPAGAVPTGMAPVSESFGNLLGAQGTAPATSSVAATGGANPATWGHMVQQMVMEIGRAHV